MAENKDTGKPVTEKICDKLNKWFTEFDASIPWFDVGIFLRYFFQSLCIYLIADSSFGVLACVVGYHILRESELPFKDTERKRNKDGVSPSSKKNEFRITFSMIYEYCFLFLVQYFVLLFVYIISCIGFSLLTFVLACYAAVLDTPSSLTDKIGLENINEKKLKALLRRLGTEKPKWLNTPDHERVLWLNKIIKQLWPHMGAYIEDVIANMIDDFKIKLTIESLFHGNEAPKISSVTVREKPDTKMIFLDVNLIYGGDFSGCIKYKGIEFEITYIKIEAAVQIELSNFVGHVPFVGKIVVHMEKQPNITPTLKKAAALFENRIVVSQIENAIKKCFPVSHVLVADAVEDLQEGCSLSPGSRIHRDRGVKKDASPVKSKSNTQWGLLPPIVKETAKKAQIITYLQEPNNPRNRLSDPGPVAKQVLGSMDTLSLGQTVDLQRSFNTSSTNPAANISSETNSSKWIENTRSESTRSNQASIPSISSTSLASASLNTADVSTQSLNTNIVSDLHSMNKRDDELDFSATGTSLDSPERTESPVSSTLLQEVNLESSQTWQHASRTESLVSSTVERTSTESSPGKWEGGLRAAIARDVESSSIIVPEKDSTDSVDNESIASEDVIGPFTLVSREGLTGIMASNSSHGCVELTTTFQAPDTLVVIVHRARNLPKKGGRTPNPYVKLHLLNQELKDLKEESTPIFDSNADPEFDCTIAFPLAKPLSEYILRVSVKTKHKLPHHLGQVLLCFAPYSTNQKMKERNWYDLADPKKDYVMCWVGYKDSMRIKERDQVDSYDGDSTKSEEFGEHLI